MSQSKDYIVSPGRVVYAGGKRYFADETVPGIPVERAAPLVAQGYLREAPVSLKPAKSTKDEAKD